MKQRANRVMSGFLVAVACVLAAARSGAAQAGAWETFSTPTNAAAWGLYDDYDGSVDYAPWDGTVAGGEFIYGSYTGDSGLSLFTDATAGGGALVGDYAAAKIAGIGCDLYIGDLTVLDILDCSIYANGPNGNDYYYSEDYIATDFPANGWSSVLFSFDRPWYFTNDFGATWVEVNAKSLTAIQELDFDFFPKVGSSGGSEVGIDNVTLEPTLVAPPVVTALSAGSPRNFTMSFTPGPGLACGVEKMRLPPAVGWDVVVGETAIVGPVAHVFQTPVMTGSGIFRVAAEPAYTPIVTP